MNDTAYQVHRSFINVKEFHEVSVQVARCVRRVDIVSNKNPNPLNSLEQDGLTASALVTNARVRSAWFEFILQHPMESSDIR